MTALDQSIDQLNRSIEQYAKDRYEETLAAVQDHTDRETADRFAKLTAWWKCDTMYSSSRGGETGICAELKIRWPSGHEGSSPSRGTSRDGEIGRCGRLRTCWPKGRGGSSPSLGRAGVAKFGICARFRVWWSKDHEGSTPSLGIQ